MSSKKLSPNISINVKGCPFPIIKITLSDYSVLI